MKVKISQLKKVISEVMTNNELRQLVQTELESDIRHLADKAQKIIAPDAFPEEADRLRNQLENALRRTITNMTYPIHDA